MHLCVWRMYLNLSQLWDNCGMYHTCKVVDFHKWSSYLTNLGVTWYNTIWYKYIIYFKYQFKIEKLSVLYALLFWVSRNENCMRRGVFSLIPVTGKKLIKPYFVNKFHLKGWAFLQRRLEWKHVLRVYFHRSWEF